MRTKSSRGPAAYSSPYLNTDIVEIILHELYSQTADTPRENRHTLSRCSLISKIWRRPAQRLLFQEIILNTPRQLESLEDATYPRTEHSRFLLGSVRILHLRVDDSDEIGGLSPSDIAPTMRLFPRLFLLRLEVNRLKEFDVSIIRALQNTPPIQALMLYRNKPPSYGKGRERPIMRKFHLQLLQIPRWRLRHFAMEGDLSSEMPSESMPPPVHKFVEVRFWTRSAPSGTAVMNWILKNSMETIKFISTPFFLPVIKKVARQLRSLDCALENRLGGSNNLSFPNAKELMWIRMGCIKTSTASRSIIPQTLVHLGIDLERIAPSTTKWKTLASILPNTVEQVSIINHGILPVTDIDQERREIEAALGGNIEIVLYDTVINFRMRYRPVFIPEKVFTVRRTLDYFKAMTRAVQELQESLHPST